MNRLLCLDTMSDAKMHLRDEFDEGVFIYGECSTCGYRGPVPEDVAFCPHCGVGVESEWKEESK